MRLATQLDASGILDLIKQSYSIFHDTTPNDYSFTITSEELNAIITDSDSMVWLAIQAHHIVGVAAGIIFTPKSYHLKLLFVSGSIQRKGIGELLLNVFENYGRENGFSLFTTNYQKWAPWSGMFYHKHGYKEYIPGDEEINIVLQETVGIRKKIKKLNNDDKCLVWKSS